MKTLMKRILLFGFSALFALCCLCLAVIHLPQTKANADSALETEFTNGGQFTVSQYSGTVPFEYVDGATEGLPTGYNGAVLKLTVTSGVAYATLDFSASNIKANMVESIVVRIYSPDYTSGTDEFRTLNPQVQYGVNTYDITSWCDITLNTSSIAGMTDANGNLSVISLGVREKDESGETIHYYIDSITVTLGDTPRITAVDFVEIETAFGWNNNTNEAGYSQTLLEFSQTLGDASDGTNQAANTVYDVATKVKLNGKSVNEWYQEDGQTTVNYLHGLTYLAIRIPVEYLALTSAEYPSLTLTIEEGTVFMNVELPAVKLVFNTGTQQWEVPELYGTPTFGRATSGMVGAWDWNHQTQNTAVIKNTNYGYTIMADWAMAANATNLAETNNLTSRSITLNGKSFSELYKTDDGYRLNAQLGFVAFSVPTSALVASNGYEYPTIEIANGTPFYAGHYLPETTLIYKDGVWQLPPQPVNYTPAFVSVGTHNHYDNATLGAWGLSLLYDTTGFYTDGGQVMATSYTGVTLNGGGEAVALWGGDQLLFWLKKEKCEPGYNGYSHATLMIEEGATITNPNGEEFILGGATLYLVDGQWTTEQPADYEVILPDALPYTGIAYGWNCTSNGSYIDTILQFGEYGVDFLGADNGSISHADANNLATRGSEPIASKLTINGVPVKNISGVTVSYAHGYNFLYISIPNYELSPTEEYKCVVLHLADRTVFHAATLSEVTLYLINGQWTEEEPTTVPTDADGTYFTASDIFNGEDSGYYADGAYKFSQTEFSERVQSEKEADATGAIYNFLYKSDSIDFDYSLLTGVGDGFSGVRLTIYRNEGEDLQGFNLFVNGTFEGAKQMAFALDQWYAVRLYTAVADGKIIVSVALEGVEIIHTEVAYDGAMGNGIQLKKSYGSVTFADFKAGDIKQPEINWQGKAVYNFMEGDAKPDDSMFMGVISVTDNYDKANFTADDISVVWETGAVKDGKLQAGDWAVTFFVSDNAGNTTSYTITASVAVSNKITITFNANGVTNSIVYTKGELIEQPADPTKAGDAEKNYIFDGWYLGDKKWDFANDCTFENIELVAVFAKEYKEYTVTVTSEGLKTEYTYTLQMRLGSTIDDSIFARAGYSFVLTEDGEEIRNITVDGDMQIKAVYTKNAEEDSSSDSAPTDSDSSSDSSNVSSNSSSEKSGCKGSIDTTLIALVLAFVGSAFVFVKSSTKVGKEDE